MPRKATGQIIEPNGNRQTWALRVPFNGQRIYIKLGRDGWNRARAERELRHVMADIERGIWTPNQAATQPEPVRAEPTFHEFADDWYTRRQHEWREGTRADYRWALEYHLLPHFGRLHLSEITVEEVDRYRSAKLAEGRLGPNQINKTITRLGQVLEDAVEYGHLDRNPARVGGRRRRAKPTKPERTTVEPEQLPTLIDSANPRLRPVLAMLAGAGLRVGEAVALDWRDVNLATGTVYVRRSKTDAGSGRTVDMPSGLVEALSELKARARHTRPSDPVFTSEPRNGCEARQTKRNVEARLKAAIKRANERLDELGIAPISERVTPHSLRRTYASLRFAVGDDPVYVSEQLGHTKPSFSMEVYARAVKRRERLSGAYLAEYERALDWARIGPCEGLGTGSGTTPHKTAANLPCASVVVPPESASESQKTRTPGA